MTTSVEAAWPPVAPSVLLEFSIVDEDIVDEEVVVVDSNWLIKDDTVVDVLVLVELFFAWAPPLGPALAAIVAACLKPEFRINHSGAKNQLTSLQYSLQVSILPLLKVMGG